MSYELSNPYKEPINMDWCNEKLKNMSLLLMKRDESSESGSPGVGSLFHFIFGIKREHQLNNNFSNLIRVDDENQIAYYAGTAATDGKTIFYSEDALINRTPLEIMFVEMHELNHIIYNHCNPLRCVGKNRKIWNWAVDYCVNNKIEAGFREIASKRNGDWKQPRLREIMKGFDKDINYQYPSNAHPLWNNELLKPYYLEELLDDLRKEAAQYQSEIDKLKGKQPKNQNPDRQDVQSGGDLVDNRKPKRKSKKEVEGYKKEWIPVEERLNFRHFVDYSVRDMLPEEIYDKIMEIVEPVQDQLNNLIDQLNDENSSDHPDIDLSESDLLGDLLEAQKFVQGQGIGKDPYGVSELIDKLLSPELSAEEIIRVKVNEIYTDNGTKNDWSRFRRRGISMEPDPLYIPKKKDSKVRYLAVLDTSGSMSNHDMALGISQLQALEGKAEGTIVFCDAQVYWDCPVSVKSVSDLEGIEAKGRGGTVFQEFFNDWETHFDRSKYDFIIVMTDGGIFDLHQLKHPRKDVFWIITTGYDFQAPFGRTARLKVGVR